MQNLLKAELVSNTEICEEMFIFFLQQLCHLLKASTLMYTQEKTAKKEAEGGRAQWLSLEF